MIPAKPIGIPPVLVVVGVHREELDFGQSVVADLDPQAFSILAIPEGLSGRRPSPDEVYRYELLHRALYLQILPHVQGRHRLLIDLHTGQDSSGPTADLMCADSSFCRVLERQISGHPELGTQDVRILPLGASGKLPKTQTVIPREIWNNPAFQYLGMEIYLPHDRDAMAASRRLALHLLRIAGACLKVGDGPVANPPAVRPREICLSAADVFDAHPNELPGSPGKAPR